MEELKRQMAESLPGTMPLFAEAFQRMTGGGLTGQKAIAKLLDEVSKGNVESARILPIVAQLMSEKAAPGLAVATKTSASEQERFQNTIDDLLILAEPKTERAFSRLFKSFSSGLKQSQPLALGIATAFEKTTNVLEAGMGLVGHMIQGWSMLNDEIKIGELGIGNLGLAMTGLMFRTSRLVMFWAGLALLVHDAVETLTGNENTLLGRVGGKIGQKIADFPSEYRAKQRQEITDRIYNPSALRSGQMDELLQARAGVKRVDLKSNTGLLPAQRVRLHEMGRDATFTPYGQEGPGGQIAKPPSEAMLRYLTRATEINENELRYERALIDAGYDPKTVDKLGDKFASKAEQENLAQLRGEVSINANININAESSEEAIENVRKNVEAAIEQGAREALVQFPQNTN